MTAGVPLDALSSHACASPTSLSDPLVSSGGAYRPLAFERWTPLALGASFSRRALLALVDGAAWWLDGDAGASSPRLVHSEPGAHFVGAVPTDGGGLLLLDAAPAAASAGWVSSAATAPLRRRAAPASARRATSCGTASARTSFRRARSHLRPAHAGAAPHDAAISRRRGAPRALAVTRRRCVLLQAPRRRRRRGGLHRADCGPPLAASAAMVAAAAAARCATLVPHGSDLLTLDVARAALLRVRGGAAAASAAAPAATAAAARCCGGAASAARPSPRPTATPRT